MRKIKKILSLLDKIAHEFIALGKHYGATYAFYNLLWWLCFYFRTPVSFKVSTFAIKKKTIWLDKYIEEKYADILELYHNRKEEPIRAENYKIWVFWGQGESEMPRLVKACYQQLKRNNANVHLVTNENLKVYITLPDTILRKVGEGRISWAHFSDIIRMTLLAKYGGLWLDTTVWVPTALPMERLSSMSLFTANGSFGYTSTSMRFWTSFQWNWSSWCLWGREPNYLLFGFVSEMLKAIAVREDYWPDYVIQDYLIYYACRRFPSVCKDMDEVKRIPCVHRNDLASVMDKPYNEETYNHLIATDFVFKLSFRTQWQEKTPQGEQTFYGKLICTNK